ncbi:MAG: HugZ family pyridoxamine 5'-phosphate oxidase [Planctomycetota bacterium]
MSQTPQELAETVKRWLAQRPHGTLSTLSAHEGIEGFPFGSVTPFALTEDGHPILILADIAQHAKNLRADARGSLLVEAGVTEGDAQATWRVTLIGRFQRASEALPEADVRGLEARYLARFPKASGASSDGSHGFRVWVLTELCKVRVIGGFGRIAWLDPALYEATFRAPTGKA